MFKLIAVKYKLVGDCDFRTDYETSIKKAVSKQTLKNKLYKKLMNTFPESNVYGGKKYFEFIEEVYREDGTGNINTWFTQIE